MQLIILYNDLLYYQNPSLYGYGQSYKIFLALH